MRLSALTVIAAILAAVTTAIQADELPVERQIEIIEHYMYVTGQALPAQVAALEDASGWTGEVPLKCGTPALLEFVTNRDKLDPALLKAMGVQALDRPTYDPDAEYVYDSPAGYFKVHYAKTGLHAVYEASVDGTVPGVPAYVEAIANILDSVYGYIVDTLGYPAPPTDDFYPEGGDARYDVYLRDFLSPIFGQTWPDTALPGQTYPMRMTSFVELENDYSERIYETYWGRPLDAIRVTAAHEFFHVVQFGMDATEFETDTSPPRQRHYWIEMSSVWMEEEIYDDINDYYSYLDVLYTDPWYSIQQVDNPLDLHPYASSVFAMYLSQVYGRDIIRDIWVRCTTNAGPDFLLALDSVIDSVSAGTAGLPHAFRAFALWNYFTGQRARLAPDGIGFEEAAAYPMIPEIRTQRNPVFPDQIDTIPVILRSNGFPFLIIGKDNPRTPEHNGTGYLKFDRTYAILTDSIGFDTTVEVCMGLDLNNCSSTFDQTITIDDLMSVRIGIGSSLSLQVPPQPWGVSILYQLDAYPDSFLVDTFFLTYISPVHTVADSLQIISPKQYRSIILIATPASYWWPAYTSNEFNFNLTYGVFEVQDQSLLNTGRPAAVLTPYPNPAVVSQMQESHVRFRFQVPTDRFADFVLTGPSFTVDIFNLAGEFVAALDTTLSLPAHDKDIVFTVSWDMNNEQGRQVASGVYIAVGRLFTSVKHTDLLAEDRVKVAIIR